MMKHDQPEMSRGFGFVTFDDEVSRRRAVEGLHNQEWNGKTVSVKAARERDDMPGNGKGGKGGSSAPPSRSPNPSGHPDGDCPTPELLCCNPIALSLSADARKVFVGGVSFQSSDDSLRRAFERIGPVLDCHVMKESTTQKSKGFAFVTFQHAEVSWRQPAHDSSSHLPPSRCRMSIEPFVK